MPVHITVHGLPADDALERLCNEEAERLARACGRILSCHISISRPPHHHEDLQLCMAVAIPGSLLVIDPTIDGDEPLATALHRAFEAMHRRLDDEARRRRCEVTTHATPPHAASAGSTPSAAAAR